MRDFATD